MRLDLLAQDPASETMGPPSQRTSKEAHAMRRDDSTTPGVDGQTQPTGGYHYIFEDGQRRWHALPRYTLAPDLEWRQMMAARTRGPSA